MDNQRRRNLDQNSPLDPNLAERVLSGALAPEDLPPALGPLAEVIGALRDDSMRADASPAVAEGERDRATIDSMMTILSDPTQRPARRRPWVRLPSPSPMPRSLGGVRVRLATSVVAVMLAFLVGTAYAGRLPGPAQNVASVVLSKVGLSVPRHDEQNGGDQSGDQGRHGPDPTGPAHDGLCNAYFHGNGGVNGGKNDSTAFTNLVDAATKAGGTVEQFCGVQQGGSGTAAGNEKGNHGKGHDSQESDDQQGGNEQGSGDDEQGQDEQGSKGHGSSQQDDGNHGKSSNHDDVSNGD
jgi:hypothetical protein